MLKELTVSELIVKLQEMPQDLPVRTVNGEYGDLDVVCEVFAIKYQGEKVVVINMTNVSGMADKEEDES